MEPEHPNLYPRLKTTGNLQNVFHDSDYDDEGGEKKNLVVQYVQQLEPSEEIPQHHIWILQEQVAELAKVSDINSIFPNYVPKAERKKKLSPRKSPYSDEVQKCPKNHDEYTDGVDGNYHACPFIHYFEANNNLGFLVGQKCRQCRRQVIGVKNKDEWNKKPDIFVISGKTPVYICGEMQKTQHLQCAKTGIVCSDCWVQYHQNSTGKRTRTCRK